MNSLAAWKAASQTSIRLYHQQHNMPPRLGVEVNFEDVPREPVPAPVQFSAIIPYASISVLLHELNPSVGCPRPLVCEIVAEKHRSIGPPELLGSLVAAPTSTCPTLTTLRPQGLSQRTSVSASLVTPIQDMHLGWRTSSAALPFFVLSLTCMVHHLLLNHLLFFAICY